MQIIKHRDSVNPKLLAVLHSLMTNPAFDSFSLAGGTSLSLRFGHRTSVDIDLFSREPFDSMLLQTRIAALFPESQILNRTEGSLCVNAGGIKIDHLYHPYPLLERIETEGALRIMSVTDVSAMKVNAVTNRGSKKDFIDLYALHLNGIKLNQSINHFCRKYTGNKFLAIRSLLWLQDADEEPDPLFLNGWTWALVREKMLHLAETLE